MKIIDRVALILVIIGGLHLLLIGLLDINLFEMIFGAENQTITNVIYILIGISAIWCFKYFGYTPKGGSRLRDR